MIDGRPVTLRSAPRPTPGASGSPATTTRSAGSSSSTRSAQAGYRYTELGPTGFLPQDPEQLSDELGSRGLTLCGGTVFAGLHRGAEALDDAIAACAKEARLLTALGAKHLVLLPEQYTDMHGGKLLESPEQRGPSTRTSGGTSPPATTSSARSSPRSTASSWCSTRTPTPTSTPRPAWSGSCVDTDPAYVNLCLDTGHISYCDGDNIAIIQRFPERIRYVHLKQVDPRCAVASTRRTSRWPRPSRSASCASRRTACPTCRRCSTRLAALPVDLFTVVEQDLYPVEPHIPLPIAARTAGYLRGCGLGPVRRWPYHILKSPRTRGTLDDEYPQVLAWSSCRCSRPRLRRRLQQPGRRPEPARRVQRWRRRRASPAARTTRSR